jgi:two-component system CheB/CheR fusion protein
MEIDFPVIGIGASAGGLEPLELFFDNVSKDVDSAFVIVQHLSPNHKSLMDELLARHTELPIKIIEDNLKIEKGTIYLNPPKSFVEINEGKFVLTDKKDRKLSFPISVFFKSLAREMDHNSCAIILSGTGSDGSEGIKYIKESGGLVLIQDPDESKFDGMPNSAISTGVADKVCKVDSLHSEIDSFFKNIKDLNKKKPSSDSDELIVNKILDAIYKTNDVDFNGYKKSTVRRRLSRRMSLLGFNSLESYYDKMKNDPKESNLLSKEILIGVTRFFRDKEAFELLRDEVIPRIVKENAQSKSLRVWIPACSTGEEAYSIAILIKDYLRQNKLQYEVSIFATDLDKEALKKAGDRIFPENISTEIPKEYLDTYFMPHKSGYSITKDIREMIVFSPHNLVQNAPFNKMDLVSCRNFLIYLENEVQQRLFVLFQYALRTNGVLFLGSSESLGDAQDDFIEINKRYKFFINKENRKFIQRPIQNRKVQKGSDQIKEATGPLVDQVNTNRNQLLNEIQHTLIQEYVPDSIVVDREMNLVHTSGNANQWLSLPSGEVSSNALKMLPQSISVPIEIVANRVLNSGESTMLTDIKPAGALTPFFEPGQDINIHIKSQKLSLNSVYLFITFKGQHLSNEEVDIGRIRVNEVSEDKIHILERELRVIREELQTTVEELESSNEELQASNEELQSSNEELESVNEELYTVNSEFQQKNAELAETNDDLDNLIESTDIALLFLDSNLNIRKFTPALKKILDLVPHDVGRNISHFRGKIQLDNFIDQIEGVLESLIPFESKVTDTKGHEYLLRISPFRTKNNEIKGIIVVFVDLTKVNNLEQALSKSDRAMDDMKVEYYSHDKLFKLIEYNVRDMICIIDETGDFEYTTPSGVDITRFSVNEIKKLNLFERIPKTKQLSKVKKALKNSTYNETTESVQFEFIRKDGKHDWFEVLVKEIQQVEPKKRKFLLTIRSIQDRITKTEELRRISLIAEQTSNAVIITDTQEKIVFTNKSFEKLTLYTSGEVVGKVPGDFLQGKETDPEVVEQMSKAIEERNSFDVNILNYNKQGNRYVVNIKAEPMFNDSDEFIGFFSIQNDITHEHEQLNEIHRLKDKLNLQYEKLKEVNQSLEDFAYIASHDLKAPVRNIKGLLEVLDRKGDDMTTEKRKEYFDIINSSSKELDRLIDNLLEYSRTGNLSEELEEVNTKKLVEEAVQQFKFEVEKHEGTIDLDIDINQISVYPILFKRLVTNLISNSIKYKGENPPIITISSSTKDSLVEFSVSDNGIGIPENQKDQIFQIFKRLNNNKDSNGIGLSVCKKIVELHGGRIWVESKLGEGTSMKFEIPL